MKHQDLRVVLIAMKQGTSMKKHQTEGSISIHVLTGQLRVQVRRQTFDLPAGHLLALDRTLTHDVEALEDSTFVLSVCANASKR